ncbi:FAD-binding oxidoreductase [Kocuria sp. CPCC 205268]|uniref:FAD-binding oxidoreductase n=1 Tax=Kocuria oxytropis TaxID=3058913 RepID=UPI0034D5C1EA
MAAPATTAGALTPEALERLRSRTRGRMYLPDDPGYDAARAVYNAMIDRRPALVLQCQDVADVIAGVDAARDTGLDLAVRGGGHNGPGLGTCEGGIVLDLAPMDGVRVDPAGARVVVEGGARWGDVDHATHAFGLACPSGIISTTGVGGLTLGGGMGYLTRKHGLTIDNLLAADVVLADGTLVTADAEHHPDLFWALRGGGGNFGVVTAFTFRLHPVDTIVGGPMLWPVERAAELLRWYRDFLPSAPEDLNGFFAFHIVPPAPPFPEELHLQRMCGVVWCWTGPAEGAEAALAPARALSPALDGVQPMPFPVLQTAFDALLPPGDQWYWRADFIGEIPDEAVELHARHGATLPTVQSTMHLYPIDGAAHRAGPTDTAFSYRDATWAMVIAGVDHDPARAAELREWSARYWDAIHPSSLGGAYVNMIMEEGQDRVRAGYRENYDRLLEVKHRYDPDNLFHVNQNIR